VTAVARFRFHAPFWVELFAIANLAFLAVDVALAHAANSFARSDEWAPIVFSAGAPLLLVPGLAGGAYQRTPGKVIGVAVGTGAIVMGLLGLVFHLESSFFQALTLKSLVYAAPFAAPLSYVGLGLLLLLNRMVRPQSTAWAQWVLLLAFGGFLGNFVLALTDHAQNGFFSTLEWVPVGAAAYGSSFLLLVALDRPTRGMLRTTRVVLGLQVLVGGSGAALHLLANLRSARLWPDSFIFGAPVFAPLLFADLALLALLGTLALEERGVAR